LKADGEHDSVFLARFATGADMMGRRNQNQGQLFYEFRLDEAVPADHLVRRIGALLDLSWVYADLTPVIDKSKREDGTFSREDFRYHEPTDTYVCPAEKTLTTSGTPVNDGNTLLYRGSTRDCTTCPLKARCCPNTPVRKIPRSIYERARDVARALAGTEVFEQSRHDRKRIEMRFAHLKRILRLGRLRLRGPRGAQDEFVLAAIAQNLRRLAKLVSQPPLPTPA
jgi:Transposase DDE domain